MKRISAADAFGLCLIKEYPNRKDKDVKRIIKGLSKDSKETAERILKRFENNV